MQVTSLREAVNAKADAGQTQAAVTKLQQALNSKVDRQECEQLLARKLDIRTFLSTQSSIGESLSPSAGAAADAPSAHAHLAQQPASAQWHLGISSNTHGRAEATPQLHGRGVVMQPAQPAGRAASALPGLTPARAQTPPSGQHASGESATFRAGDLSGSAPATTPMQADSTSRRPGQYQPYVSQHASAGLAKPAPVGGYNCAHVSPATVRPGLSFAWQCLKLAADCCLDMLQARSDAIKCFMSGRLAFMGWLWR